MWRCVGHLERRLPAALLARAGAGLRDLRRFHIDPPSLARRDRLGERGGHPSRPAAQVQQAQAASELRRQKGDRLLRPLSRQNAQVFLAVAHRAVGSRS